MNHSGIKQNTSANRAVAGRSSSGTVTAGAAKNAYPTSPDNLNLLKEWYAHTGECEQCGKVMEEFFAEASRLSPVCQTGAKILAKFLTKGQWKYFQTLLPKTGSG